MADRLYVHQHSVIGQRGFTLIEVIISIAVLGILIPVIFLLYQVQAKVGVDWIEYENADQIAFNNLNNYSRYVGLNTTDCADYSTPTKTKTLYSSATNLDSFRGVVVQTVVSSMPYGCSNNAITAGFPILVESTVTYNDGADTISHVTYVKAGGTQ